MRTRSQLVADRVVLQSIADRPTVDSTLLLVLEQVEPEQLDGADRVQLLRAIERCEGLLAGLKVRTTAAVADATEELGLHPTDARHELAAALRLSPVTASARVRVAVDLRDLFSETLKLMDDGRISYQHAAHLVRETEGLDDATARVVQASVLPVMPELTAAETRRAVRDAVVRVDPQASAERARKAHTERRIERVPDRDGVVGWCLPVPADLEPEMWAETTRVAKAVQAARVAAGLDDPGLDALRVDVVIDRVLGGPVATGIAITPDTADDSSAGRGGGSSSGGDAEWPAAPDPQDGEVLEVGPAELLEALRVAMQAPAAPAPGARVPRCSCGGAQTAAVVLDLPTALGLADNPGYLPGYGAVPADLARRMAADRDWVRWVVEPTTGQLLDRGSRRYRPSGALRAYVNARDQVCGFPSCNQPAHLYDCDHVVAFRHHGAGQTVRINLGPLCRQHHNAKTHGRWRLHYDPETGTKTWTDPFGLTYTKHTTPMLT